MIQFNSNHPQFYVLINYIISSKSSLSKAEISRTYPLQYENNGEFHVLEKQRIIKALGR